MGFNSFLMYKYYKGEAQNPFEGKNQNAAMWWFYEKHFDSLFIKNESSDWYDFLIQ